MAQDILLFGYGNHGKSIVFGLMNAGFTVTVVESNERFYQDALKDGLNGLWIDVTKDEALHSLEAEKYEKLVCVMDDEHLNVFLTLSLRSLFKTAYILSISDSIHTTKKLQMAGANKVIDLYEVSANKIHNILNRPVVTKLLEEFVMSKNGIGFKEMTIPEGSFLIGKMTDDIDFSNFGVLLLGMIDVELGDNFIFITAGVNHKIDVGDIIVTMGEMEKLKAFKLLLKEKVLEE
ncbi:MAG: hypothetical protein RL113_678 [Pseudomonadota bacterium]|jgi:voltage-gated potassium channel